ncbi:unnamed protein product [Prunus brigantina]
MLNQIFHCSNGIKFFMNVVPTYVENNISEICSNWINLAFPVHYASRHVRRRNSVAANQVSLYQWRDFITSELIQRRIK